MTWQPYTDGWYCDGCAATTDSGDGACPQCTAPKPTVSRKQSHRASARRSMSRLYWQRRHEGLCVSCGTLSPDRARCPPCQAKYRVYREAYNARLRQTP